MYTIGINYSKGHDSSIALSNKNGEIIFAVSEERFSRVKLDKAFPKKSLDYIIEKYNLHNNNVDSIAIAFESYKNIDHLIKQRWSIDEDFKQKGTVKDKIDFSIDRRKSLIKEIELYFKSKSIEKNMRFFEHHLCHNASAQYGSGFKNSLSFSIDGNGDYATGMIVEFKENSFSIKKRYICPELNFANQYSAITSLLGFRTNRHEGKITGLAAYGKYNEKCYEDVTNYLQLIKNWNYLSFVVQNNSTFIVNLLSKSKILQFIRALLKQTTKKGRKAVYQGYKLLKNYSKEDIAFSLQKITEENVLKHIKENYNNEDNICLSGGLFANVKINQKIAEHINPKQILYFQLWVMMDLL
jgi:carbamoyltransferase